MYSARFARLRIDARIRQLLGLPSVPRCRIPTSRGVLSLEPQALSPSLLRHGLSRDPRGFLIPEGGEVYKSPMENTRRDPASVRESAHYFNVFELGRWTTTATLAVVMTSLLAGCGDSGVGAGGDSGAGGNGGTGGNVPTGVCGQVFIVDL